VRTPSIVLLALLLTPVASRSAVVPTGAPVVIGTATLAQQPIDAIWTGSRFAIVSVESDDAPPARILLRYLDPFSDVATDPVEITAGGAVPQIAAFPDGSLVVVWTNYNGWFARFVDAAGVPNDEAVPLGFTDSGNARIAAGSQGEWVFVTKRHVPETESAELAGMRYFYSTPLASEPFRIEAGGSQPQVAMLPDNRFLSAWSDTIWDEDCDDCGFQCCFDWHTTYALGRGFDSHGTPFNGALYLHDFHNDEAGLNGLAIARDGESGYAGAWIDSYESDTPGVPYLVFRRFDASGSGLAHSFVFAGEEGEPTPYGMSLAISSNLAIVATSRSQYDADDEFTGEDIEIYSINMVRGPVEKLRLAPPDSVYEWSPIVTGSDGGAVLVVWESSNDNQLPVNKLVAQPFFAAPTILCGDARYDHVLSATDGLAALRAAVGSRYCAPPVCDANGDGETSATDAGLVLRASVGVSTELACPPSGDPVPDPFPEPWW
jgi:hypothetical protein